MTSRELTSRQDKSNYAQCKPGLHIQSGATSQAHLERFDSAGL